MKEKDGLAVKLCGSQYECRNLATEPHPCPRQVEVCEGSDYQCDCCSDCMQACRDSMCIDDKVEDFEMKKETFTWTGYIAKVSSVHDLFRWHKVGDHPTRGLYMNATPTLFEAEADKEEGDEEYWPNRKVTITVEVDARKRVCL